MSSTSRGMRVWSGVSELVNLGELCSRQAMMKTLEQSNSGTARSDAVDLIQYRTDGVSIWRQCFPSPIVDSLKKGWEELKGQIAHGTIQRSARFVVGSLPEPLATVYRNDNLIRVAQTILDTENVALYMNRILLKDTEWSGAVAIHQDMPYFSGGLDKVSIFVPLTKTFARNGNGGLIFLKGSHKYGNLQRGVIRRELFPPMEELAPDLDVGDVVLMDFLVWHFSEDAPDPADRPLMQIVYQPSSDGSYGGDKVGVPAPTLVSGRWMTQYFAVCGESTIPHA